MEYGLSKEIVDKIKEIIKKYPKYKFAIFGSRARGNYHKNSDIDIAIWEDISENDQYAIMNEFDCLDIIYKIDLVFISKDTKKELIESIKENNVEL